MISTLRHLLPKSEAFRAAAGRIISKFWDGCAGALDQVRLWIVMVLLDLYPSSTREIEQWEIHFGIPHDPSLSASMRRAMLAAEWRATGGQSPKYIQDVLHEAMLPVYIHEWWEPGGPPYVARDPRDYTVQPLLGYFQCSEDDDILCGDFDAQCNDWLANDPGYWDNKTLSVGAPPPVPDDPDYWPYFLYVGGETFPEEAILAPADRARFERLIQKLKPAQQWIVALIQYDDSLLPLTDESGGWLETESGMVIYA